MPIRFARLLYRLGNLASPGGAKLAAMRAWAEDEQAKRHRAEEKLMDARSEIKRLQAMLSWTENRDR